MYDYSYDDNFDDDNFYDCLCDECRSVQREVVELDPNIKFNGYPINPDHWPFEDPDTFPYDFEEPEYEERMNIRHRKTEQCGGKHSYCRGWVSRWWFKRYTNKLIRRLAKIDPQNAPRRIRDVTRGWYW